MKTNLVDLMSENSKLEKEVQELYLDLRRNNMNEDAIELDGNKQNLKDNSDFMEKYKEFNEKLRKINAIKAILFTKNNSLLLSNGSTIQAALVEISNKKRDQTHPIPPSMLRRDIPQFASIVYDMRRKKARIFCNFGHYFYDCSKYCFSACSFAA